MFHSVAKRRITTFTGTVFIFRKYCIKIRNMKFSIPQIYKIKCSFRIVNSYSKNCIFQNVIPIQSFFKCNAHEMF